MDYGEWKNRIRSEGTISCAQSVATKLGTAIGTALVGILMAAVGYDGTLQAQSVEANNMIISLNSIVPAVLCGIQLFLLKYYDLDGLLPRIRNELRLR